MKPADLLFTQGFGTRRECAALVANGMLEIEGVGVVDDLDRELDAGGELRFRVGNGELWPYRERALVVLHKPAGYECSLKPRHHASVHSLLPAPLRRRGVQAVGRLDEDTTGLLLFTDDGTLIHRLTAPKHHVAKVYAVRCVHAVDAALAERLCEGVVLHDVPTPVRAAACVVSGERSLALTLTEGKYHQVKRMVAAAGNRVEALHRESFGPMRIGDLAPGAWRWPDETEVAALQEIFRR
ncbi:MAG: pseudouridine synthase [Pseudomonadota bacterium]|nr:pseudouridine synthase [Pseudomonadota bacterium]